MRFRHRVLVLGLLVVLSACSRKRYKMPSGSMWPAIVAGDTITADTSIKSPARGDVFAFKYPEHPDQSFVKRIVGLPGDKVEMKGKTLSINGTPVPACTIGPFSFTSEDTKHEGELVLEGAGYVVFYEKEAFTTDGAWTVAPGEFWAMGDNRSNSHDSRMWFGGKGRGPQALLEGKVALGSAVLPPGAGALAANLARCRSKLGASH